MPSVGGDRLLRKARQPLVLVLRARFRPRSAEIPSDKVRPILQQALAARVSRTRTRTVCGSAALCARGFTDKHSRGGFRFKSLQIGII